MANSLHRIARVVFCLVGAILAAKLHAAPLAFPTALGQGAAARGGRGGDAYHVVNLRDYSSKQGDQAVDGSLRFGIESATGPRTIVFDVAGPIELKTRLDIRRSNLTIAGQTSPGGITLWGYPVEIRDASDVIIRHLRVRCGDFNAGPVTSRSVSGQLATGRGRRDLDASSANAVDVGGGSRRIILDHISASWGMDETLSVTNARDVTIQNSIIAESLHDSFHAKGRHGFGSLVRGDVTAYDQSRGIGGYTFYGNLWAHHQQRSPAIGGQQVLAEGMAEADRGRADVNVVNNVVYDWGQRPSHRCELGDIRINFVGNYHVNGPSKIGDYVFYENNPAKTLLFHAGNFLDSNQDSSHDGLNIDAPDWLAKAFQRFDPNDQLIGPDSPPLNFFGDLGPFVLSAEGAYERVVADVGASLWRDAVDQRVIASLIQRTGGPIDSQEAFRRVDGELPGIDDLPQRRREPEYDRDGDGMSDEFERDRGLDPKNPSDGNGREVSSEGYTNLEVYLEGLTRSTDSK